jgi:hypothetical protein
MAMILLCLASPSAFGGNETTFTGVVGDTQCAMNVHSMDKSHKEMLKVKGVGKTAADCTLYCIRNRGGRFALESKDKVYRLDSPGLVEPYAGQKVRIFGTLDTETDIIEVHRIEPLQ